MQRPARLADATGNFAYPAFCGGIGFPSTTRPTSPVSPMTGGVAPSCADTASATDLANAAAERPAP